jgi:hypothetical protein
VHVKADTDEREKFYTVLSCMEVSTTSTQKSNIPDNDSSNPPSHELQNTYSPGYSPMEATRSKTGRISTEAYQSLSGNSKSYQAPGSDASLGSGKNSLGGHDGDQVEIALDSSSSDGEDLRAVQVELVEEVETTNETYGEEEKLIDSDIALDAGTIREGEPEVDESFGESHTTEHESENTDVEQAARPEDEMTDVERSNQEELKNPDLDQFDQQEDELTGVQQSDQEQTEGPDGEQSHLKKFDEAELEDAGGDHVEQGKIEDARGDPVEEGEIEDTFGEEMNDVEIEVAGDAQVNQGEKEHVEHVGEEEVEQGDIEPSNSGTDLEELIIADGEESVREDLDMLKDLPSRIETENMAVVETAFNGLLGEFKFPDSMKFEYVFPLIAGLIYLLFLKRRFRSKNDPCCCGSFFTHRRPTKLTNNTPSHSSSGTTKSLLSDLRLIREGVSSYRSDRSAVDHELSETSKQILSSIRSENENPEPLTARRCDGKSLELQQ